MIPFLTPGLLVISLVEIIINREHYINNLRSDNKPRNELFIKNPENFYQEMKPHLNIGIIGYCPTFAGTLVSALIAEEVAKKFPDKEVQLTWIEPDQSELLEKIFPEEKDRFEYEITRGIPVFDGLIPIASKNLPIRSDFDFQKPRKSQRFQQDPKSIKLKAKHRKP